MSTVSQVQIETERGTFAVRVAGKPENPLLICLHGFPDDATTFDQLLEQLAQNGFYAAAPFCRGYAPSPLKNIDGGKFGKDLFAVLADDVQAIAHALAPDQPYQVVGHDSGAFTVYCLLRSAGQQVRSAVTMSSAHPAVVQKNTRRHPVQIWLSRYIVLFQLSGIADWWVKRANFAYIDTLWKRWSAPGWTVPAAHLAQVKKTLRASMPAPLQQYRSGGLDNGKDWPQIAVPTLFLIGSADGCALPETADGQEAYFTDSFRAEVLPDLGHFLHLEAPDLIAQKIVEWHKRTIQSKPA